MQMARLHDEQLNNVFQKFREDYIKKNPGCNENDCAEEFIDLVSRYIGTLIEPDMTQSTSVFRRTESLVGIMVEQIACDTPEFKKFVGRKSIVKKEIVDFTGEKHVLTDDSVWCPVRLVKPLSSGEG